jgi:SAM-dependent methyltransferase
MQTQEKAIDQERLQEFQLKAVNDVGAAITCANALLGEKLGLYRAMAGAGPMEPAELAWKTRTNQRLVQEWLQGQAASGYVAYDPDRGTFELPPEHAAVLADDESPAFIAGVFDSLSAIWRADERLAQGFRDGTGMGWHEHAPRLFVGTERFFRPGYREYLTSSWIPALAGVEQKLANGAKVADVGCGHGASTVIMAMKYPDSKFYGFDYHAASIETARERAAGAGLDSRVTFETADAQTFPGGEFDLVCFFDCLHDMGDPVGAARRALEALKPDGTVLLVEPMAGDALQDNLNPVGSLFYGASTFLCVANGVNQGGESVLGAQAGEARLREVFTKAGFTRFRRATETPFNLVLEAKP